MANERLQQIRFISPVGCVGGGISGAALDEALAKSPHFIACDAGTTDAGPFSLRIGTPAFPREAVKRDLSLMLRAGRKANMPMIIGSAGTAGADVHELSKRHPPIVVSTLRNLCEGLTPRERNGTALRVTLLRVETAISATHNSFARVTARKLENRPTATPVGFDNPSKKRTDNSRSFSEPRAPTEWLGKKVILERAMTDVQFSSVR